MGKEKLTKKGICVAMANKIFLTNLSEKEILNSLLDLWSIALTEGYEIRLNEQKKFKTLREASHKKDWGKQRDKIEDIIHGGLKTNN